MKNLKRKFEQAFIISDSDLDGGSAVVLATLLFPDIKFSIPKSRDLINDTLIEAINSGKYKTILMTDCSPTGEDTINAINKFVEEGNDFVLLDHHKTALDLNKYSWSKVKVETNNHKHCGTELLYLYFKELGVNISKYSEFVELVRSYDTWDWDSKGDLLPEKLNRLYYFLGFESFTLNMAYKIFNNEPLFNKEDEIVLRTIESLDNHYIEEHKTMFDTIDYEGLKVAVIFTDRCVSKLGNVICRENPDIDFCCLVDLNRQKCSMRSVEGKADVSVIAKKYNGGGHAQASGFTLNNEAKEELLKNIFN